MAQIPTRTLGANLPPTVDGIDFQPVGREFDHAPGRGERLLRLGTAIHPLLYRRAFLVADPPHHVVADLQAGQFLEIFRRFII
jgi:hypothetical protein